MKTIWKYLIGVLVGLLVTTTIIVPVILLQPEDINPPPNVLTEHDPIIIWDNNDFLDYNFKGSGTFEDPYLIEFFNITTFTSYAIYIFGTSDYFIIQNCWLSSTHPNGYAIQLENVVDETALIFNNTIINSNTGLYLSNTDKTNVVKNDFINCDYAISLIAADLTIIHQNLISNTIESSLYHMFTTSSFRLNVSENTFIGSNSLINIDHCQGSSFIGNQMINSSFYILYSQDCLILGNSGIDFNLLVFYSSKANISSNTGTNLQTYQSPEAEILHNNFETYIIREITIENYKSYFYLDNHAGDGLFTFLINDNNINLGDFLISSSQIMMVNCSNIWLVDFYYCSFENVRFDFIFSSKIDTSNSSWKIYSYFKDSSSISFSNTSQMYFYLDESYDISLINNTFTQNDIYCTSSNEISVIQNNFIQSELSLIEVDDSYVYQNYFYDGHIDLYQNQNTTLTTNTFDYCEFGLSDSQSVNLVIQDNIFTDVYDIGPRFILTNYLTFQNNSISGHRSGFSLISGLGLIANYEFSNNTVNSRPLGFFKDEENLILEDQSFGQLIILNCSYANLNNLSIENTSNAITIYQSDNIKMNAIMIDDCYQGIILVQSKHSTLSASSISNCTNIGLTIDSSSQSKINSSTFSNTPVGTYVYISNLCIFENNTWTKNNDGLRISRSNYVVVNNCKFLENYNRGLLISGINLGCNVTYTLFENNQGYAIEIAMSSASHLIHHNAFIGNNPGGTSQAMDREGGSMWYDISTLEGSYWDDWSGTGSYSIDWEEVQVVDPYPLHSNPLD